MHRLSFLILFLLYGLVFAQSPHGDNFNYECSECHTTDTWKINLKKLNFDHSKTGFELAGQHANLDCQTCHTSLDFVTTKNKCFDCHNDVHQNTLDKNCQLCHNSKSWLVENINEIHNRSRFPLLGAHITADCQQCHKTINNLIFEELGVECIDCHVQDYNNTQNPNHVLANFSKDCVECHSTNDKQWRQGTFNHDFFPLTLGHKISNCFECHNTQSFTGLDQTCYTCHQSDFSNTKDPNHVSAGFSKDCIQCHTTNPGWKPANFKIHDQFFVLDGAHKKIENNCAQCHSNGYTNTPKECIGCHESNYNSTTNPDHKSTGFGTDCESCHSTVGWTPATFDHDNQFFPIYSGKHNNEWDNCSDCHTNQSDYSVFSCITCHEHSQSKMDDEHKEVQGYAYESQACLTCHPQGDKEGAIDHSKTAFPLTGLHVTADCAQCHANGYSGTPTECYACHEDKYTNTAEPKHGEAGLSHQCETCHTTSVWKPSTFDHNTTGFELIGGHSLPQCSSCHKGSTENTSPLCYSCHQDQYANAENHVSQNYPTTCEQCHNTTDWKDADFDHANTNFPLTGAHVNTDCAQCHTNGYTGTPTDCNSCHNTNYQQTTNPDHQNLGLSTNCETCHTTNPGWKPAEFPVHNDYYVLEGAHASISNDCATCHNGDYNNTPNTCYGCHQSDYESTNDPPHQSNGFSTDCESCHTQTAWKPSTFDHDNQYFPIYSGKHKNKWDNCSDCHTNQSDYSVFSCITCHEHSQSKMDDKHKDVSGYVYDSNACYDCHPNGKEDGGVPNPLHIKRMRY